MFTLCIIDSRSLLRARFVVDTSVRVSMKEGAGMVRGVSCGRHGVTFCARFREDYRGDMFRRNICGEKYRRYSYAG